MPRQQQREEEELPESVVHEDVVVLEEGICGDAQPKRGRKQVKKSSVFLPSSSSSSSSSPAPAPGSTPVPSKPGRARTTSSIRRPRKKKNCSDLSNTRGYTDIPAIPSVFLPPRTDALRSSFERLAAARDEHFPSPPSSGASSGASSSEERLDLWDLLQYEERAGRIFHNTCEEFYSNLEHRVLNEAVGPALSQNNASALRVQRTLQQVLQRLARVIPESQAATRDDSVKTLSLSLSRLQRELTLLDSRLGVYCRSLRAFYLYENALKDRLWCFERVQRVLVRKLVQEIKILSRVPLGPSPPGAVVFGQERIGGAATPEHQKYVGHLFRLAGAAHQRRAVHSVAQVESLRARDEIPIQEQEKERDRDSNSGQGGDLEDVRLYATQCFQGVPYKKFKYRRK